jgi:hypothetical protein
MKLTMTDIAALVWLAQRANAIRNAKGWTKAELDRSWVAWYREFCRLGLHK